MHVSFDGRKYTEKEVGEVKNIEIIAAKEESLLQKTIFNLPNNGTFKLLRAKLSQEYALNDIDFDIMVTKTNFRITQDKEEEYLLSLLG